jgi:hypothetical protein
LSKNIAAPRSFPERSKARAPSNGGSVAYASATTAAPSIPSLFTARKASVTAAKSNAVT